MLNYLLDTWNHFSYISLWNGMVRVMDKIYLQNFNYDSNVFYSIAFSTFAQ